MSVYRGSVGKVELSGVFEEEMLTLLPLRVLIFQVDSESFNVLDPCGDTRRGVGGVHRGPGGIVSFKCLLVNYGKHTLLQHRCLVWALPVALRSFPSSSFTVQTLPLSSSFSSVAGPPPFLPAFVFNQVPSLSLRPY